MVSWIEEMQAALDAGADPQDVLEAVNSGGSVAEIIAAIDDAAPDATSNVVQALGTTVGSGIDQWGSIIGYPTPIPVRAATAQAQLTNASSGGSPAATGVEILKAAFGMLVSSEQLRQQSVDQGINLAQIFAELSRTSPTTAANLATALGLGSAEPDLSFANSFTSRNATGMFGGQVGSQEVYLPFAFNGKQLSYLSQNTNVSRMLADIAGYFGKPDIFNTSAGSMIPSGLNLAGLV